jgi:hypothetical protein
MVINREAPFKIPLFWITDASVAISWTKVSLGACNRPNNVDTKKETTLGEMNQLAFVVP